MSDDQNWQAPGSPDIGDAARNRDAPGTEQPRYGEYAPGYEAPGAPAYQQPDWQQQDWQRQQGTSGQQPGWAPPPKPGLIPLRPLPLGTLLGAPFQVLRRNPKITVGAALLLQGLPSIVVSLLIAGIVFLLVDRVYNADAVDQGALTAGAIGGTIVLGVLSIVISTVFSSLLQGIVVAEVSRETLGEKLGFGALWQRVRGRFGALIGWAFLFALAWLIAVSLVVAAVAALATIGGLPGVVGAVLAGLLGGLGLVALGIWVNTKLAIVPSAIVIERLPIRSAMARSWRLTHGHFWRTFGVIVLIAVIVGVVTQVIATPFSLLGGILGGLFAPTSLSTSDPSAFNQLVASQLGVNVLAALVAAVVGAIGSVVQTSATALIYVDLRMRTEGLDLELVRFVEARQAGQDLPDPYTTPAPAASTPPWPGP